MGINEVYKHNYFSLASLYYNCSNFVSVNNVCTKLGRESSYRNLRVMRGCDKIMSKRL